MRLLALGAVVMAVACAETLETDRLRRVGGEGDQYRPWNCLHYCTTLSRCAERGGEGSGGAAQPCLERCLTRCGIPRDAGFLAPTSHQ